MDKILGGAPTESPWWWETPGGVGYMLRPGQQVPAEPRIEAARRAVEEAHQEYHHWCVKDRTDRDPSNCHPNSGTGGFLGHAYEAGEVLKKAMAELDRLATE